MSRYLVDDVPYMGYVDRHELLRSMLTEEAFRRRRQELLSRSSTVYVGNLSFYTEERQLWGHFASCGLVRDVVMGLNETTRQPCGFCFVVYETHAAATRAVQLLHGSLLDDRVISVGWDVGCDLGRRWGRGAEGGQVVDAVRLNLDDGRGGLGALRRGELRVQASVGEELLTYDWVAPRSGRRTGAERRPRETVSARASVARPRKG